MYEFTDAVTSRYDEIQRLIEAGVLSKELCPRSTHLHWAVLRLEELPADMRGDWFRYGEIRWP